MSVDEFSMPIVGGSGSEPTEKVLKMLRERGALSSADIARMSGLAKSTVSGVVNQLEKSGIITKAASNPGESRPRGRPATLLTLNPSVGGLVGIALARDKVHVVLADVSHSVLATSSIHVGLDYSPEDGLSAAEQAVADVAASVGFRPDQIFGIGVAISGPVHPVTGRVGRSDMIPRWRGVRAGEAFSAQFPMPVFIDNESNCSAVGELMWGAARDVSNVVYIKLDLGVGGAVILDGKLVRGIAGGAGEFGHMTYREDGPLCGCGNRGCFAMYCSTPVLLDQLRGQNGSDFTVSEMIEAARRGDVGCARVVADAGAAAGEAVALACNMFNPERVIVGGVLSLAGDVLFAPLRRSFHRHSLLLHEGVEPDATTAIVPGTTFGNDPAIGAIGLALRRLGEVRTQRVSGSTHVSHR